MNTRIFINGSTTRATQEEMDALTIGDTIRMVVRGNRPSLVGAKFIVKVDNADVSAGGFLVTAHITPIREDGTKEFYYDFPITRAGAYAIEGYVNTIPPTITSTPVPTDTPTETPTPTPTPVGGIFGNGADGACTATGSVNLNSASCAGRATPDAVNFAVTADVAVGASSVTLAAAPAGIAVGDEVLLIDLQGPGNVGDYETADVTAIAGNALTLNKNLTKAFNGTTDKIMIQRVPHYTTVTVSGSLTAKNFSCTNFSGGVIFFRANGAVNVASAGAIDMSGRGYIGGSGAGNQIPGFQGASTAGCGDNLRAANGGGGGGGKANGTNVDPINGGAGAGGAYGTAGADGGDSSGGNRGGNGGAVYGVPDLTTKLYLGSGGGKGGNEQSGPSGNGGDGGGIIAIFGDSITVAGRIRSNGGDGVVAQNTAGSGGGGAGGSIFLYSKNLTLGSNLVKAVGGTGGNAPTGNNTAKGGNGGNGRISVRYSTASTGTTTPAANSAQLSLLNRWLLNKLAWVNMFDRR